MRKALALVLVLASCAPAAGRHTTPAPAVETRVPVDSTALYVRAVGRGRPVIVLHGGPDFDHAYLLPDLDRLADTARLVYYDQRGRGRSTAGVRAEQVSLASEIDDLDAVRRHVGADAPVLLGHSWGAVLALEYALRHPDRVSALVLLNPAPASAADAAAFRAAYVARLGDAMARQRAIVEGAAYRAGDPDAVAARYRIHFAPALRRPEDLERLMRAMHAGFVRQGSTGILLARAAEDRIMADTWQVPGYDLLPRLRALRMPALVIAGADDFIPVPLVGHIAAALPRATLVTLPACGHFAYMECPAEVRAAVRDFLARVPTQ